MSAPVKVQIFGQTYTIHGELDAAYVQKLAAYVDEKMRAIAAATATIDTQRSQCWPPWPSPTNCTASRPAAQQKTRGETTNCSASKPSAA